MRIALVTPYYYPSVRGNAVTVGRIAAGLRERGHQVEVFSLDAFENSREIPSAIRVFDPDVVHGFHAFMTGELVVEEAKADGILPLVTITGTDVNIDLFHPERRARVVDVLVRARGLVVFHESIRKKLLQEIPDLDGKIRVIRQTVACGEKTDDYRARWGLDPHHAIFFLPAGIRSVKNLLFCIPPLSRLQTRHPEVRAIYAGPIVEEEEGRRLLGLLAGNQWARYLGAVPHEAICSMLRVVDVVVNSSFSEGGMSNAILEAMSRGVAVLASDIEGNRSIVVDEVDGLLFASEEDFERKAERLVLDPDLRRRLGRQARAKIEREFPREREIDAYEELYHNLLGAGDERDA
jgi:glycosyltransferase involved in cell wall biosynthesis